MSLFKNIIYIFSKIFGKIKSAILLDADDDQVNTVPTNRSHSDLAIDEPSYKKRVGFIVGHTQDQQGARSRKRKVSEYLYNRAVIEVLKIKVRDLLHTTRDVGGVRGACERLVKAGVTHSVELHCNDYKDTRVGGYEALVIKGDKASMRLADEFLTAMNFKFPSKTNRGIKALKKGDRGYYNLLYAKQSGIKSCILAESFFINNEKDWIKEDDLAHVLSNLVDEIEDY